MQYPSVPGYGGGTYPINSSPMLPDYMSVIQEELAKNQALGEAQKAQKPSFGSKLGDFLKAWAGSLGDSLTGNPVYSTTMAQRQQSEAAARAEEQRRKQEQDWWYEQQRYKAQNEKPDMPGIADETKWFYSLPPEEQARAAQYIQMRNPAMQAPTLIPYGYEPVAPSSGGAPGGLREQAIEAIRKGADPVKVLERLKQLEGGQSASPAGGFL